MRLVLLTRLAAVVALSACAGANPRRYGQFAALQPQFTSVPGEKTPQHLNVSLGQPAYVTVLFVVPGRGAAIIYPTDSTTSTRLSAGSQQIALRFPSRPTRDSLLAMSRRAASAGRGTGGRQGRLGQRDSTRFIADTSLGMARAGYLLMVASPEPLSYGAVLRRTQGITIPFDDSEALNTVVKLVRGTLPERAAWAALAKEIDLG